MIKRFISSIVLSRDEEKEVSFDVRLKRAEEVSKVLLGKLACAKDPHQKKQMYDRICHRAQYLLRKYKDPVYFHGKKFCLARQHVLFQVLALSTQRETLFFDFPGTDSVERFILREL